MIDRCLLVLLLLFVRFGCNLFSRGGDEMVFSPTEVGTPVGDKISKEIGPAGGVLASADGRLTFTVPPNAMTETISFSIQPISNMVGNGLGPAYRLEPDGKTFTAPLKISIHYDERDLEGTIPEMLLLAYQDKEGGWHELPSTSMNAEAKTLTVTTNHFTDFSFLKKMSISPTKATLRPGEKLTITLIGCAPRNPISKWWGPSNLCIFGEEEVPALWYVDIGTITRDKLPAIYTAPPRKPTPNIATVVLPYLLVDRPDKPVWSSDDLPPPKTGMFISHITIVDRGYKATGGDGPVSYSGVICSLEVPFEVTGTHPLFTFPFKFTPTSATGGTMAYQTSWAGTMATGGGPYKIEGLDTEVPRIVIESQSTHQSQVVTTSGGGKATILLAPLAANEAWCNE